MLYLIGIGLNNEKDINVNGLEAVRKCSLVYLETYTSKLSCSIKELESFYKKKIIQAERALIESGSKEIIGSAKTKNVAVLIIGDVFSATTHISLMLDAKKAGVEIKVIHNASIMTAVGIIGLELYKYGKVTSIPFENKEINAPIDALNMNLKNNLHTLILLDLDPINNKFMTVNEAVDYLIKNKVSKEIIAVGCAGLGSEHYEIKAGKLSELNNKRFSRFPQCLVIPAKKLHFVEEEALLLWSD